MFSSASHIFFKSTNNVLHWNLTNNVQWLLPRHSNERQGAINTGKRVSRTRIGFILNVKVISSYYWQTTTINTVGRTYWRITIITTINNYNFIYNIWFWQEILLDSCGNNNFGKQFLLLAQFLLQMPAPTMSCFLCTGCSMYAIEAACVLIDEGWVDLANTWTHEGGQRDRSTEMSKSSTVTGSTRPWQLSPSLWWW